MMTEHDTGPWADQFPAMAHKTAALVAVKQLVNERAAQDIEDALVHLRVALESLKRAGAKRTADRVRLAISSAKGALRHANNRHTRRDL